YKTKVKTGPKPFRSRPGFSPPVTLVCFTVIAVGVFTYSRKITAALPVNSELSEPGHLGSLTEAHDCVKMTGNVFLFGGIKNLSDFLSVESLTFAQNFLVKDDDVIIIVRETPISGVRTFYTDANKQGKAGYKSEDLSKVVQSPYNSVQKSELYAILLVLMDFSEPLNIVTDSQYAERVVLHIETAEFIPDESELTSLFIQLQDIIRNRKHPLYITHIRSHTGLPGPLAQGNDEIDKLLIGNVLEASEFHKKHHVNSKGLKRDFSITWQQAKEIVRKCPTCSFYNQTPLPAGCNPKGTQRNDIWQMDVFHFAEFGKLKYVHHTIDTYSGFQWATALSSEKADSVITHLLEVMAIMGIPAQIKTDNAPAYVSVFSFVYDYETCQLLAAPIYFREDMGIEEPADGVNFHSGKRTHWMKEIVSLIVSKGDPTWVQTVNNSVRFPGMESKHSQKLLLDQDGPRFMSTHLPIQLFPKSYFTSSAKIIYVIRNPRDVLTSVYHIRKHLHPLKNQMTFDEYFHVFIQGDGPQRQHAKSVSISGQTEQLDSAVQNSSFSVMKENSMSNSIMLKNPKDDTVSNIPLLRKGICGDWKTHFTVAQSEAFDRVYQEKMLRLDPGLFPWSENC
ncbi:hypothetical protein STEG23_027713, partial [Scotinomys teguina]